MAQGHYREESDEPLTEKERDQIRRSLSDPLTYPNELSDYIRNLADDQIINTGLTTSQARGPWKVWDHTVAGAEWSGSISARGWTADVPNVTQYIAGHQVKVWDAFGDKTVAIWNNAFDGSRPHYDPTATSNGDIDQFGGWLRGQKMIVNEINQFLVKKKARDGTGSVTLADIGVNPYLANGSYEIMGFPVQAVSSTLETRVLIHSREFNGFISVDAAYLTDEDGITSVLRRAYANFLNNAPYSQRGSSNITNFEHHISNRERYGLGLVTVQPQSNDLNGSEIIDHTGALIDTFKTSGTLANSQGYDVQISPNGRYIAWTGINIGGGGISELWFIDLAAAAPAIARLGSTNIFYDFCWSPDSEYIIFVNQSNFDLYAMDLFGTMTRLTNAAGTYMQPDWKGNALICLYDNATDVKLVDVDPLAGTHTSLVTVGLTTTVDVMGNNFSHVVSPGGVFVAHTVDSGAVATYGSKAIFDVYVHRTIGNAAV